MRWVVMFLGVVTVVLAGVLATQGQWWIAMPDAFFGLGVTAFAYASLHSGELESIPAGAPEPAPAPSKPPQPAVAPPVPSPRRRSGRR